MVNKPEIQYVGQFYVHGSEAPALKKEKKKAPVFLARPEKHRKIYVDPVAFCGLLVAAVMLVALVLGALQLQQVWQEHYVMQEYLSQLKRENAALEHNYRISYDLEEIRKLSDTLGLVPMEEVEAQHIRVTHPEPRPQRSWLDDVRWFFEGLFA